jgi:hypothetical protein
MIFKTLSIRDQKGECFNTPYFCRTIGEGERNFEQLVNDPKSLPGTYPDDFDLYHVADFDDQTGKFQYLDTPQHLCKAIQMVKKLDS